MMLVAASRSVIIPDAERHAILMGCTANILEIVVAEVVGAVVLVHHTTVFADVNGNILSHELIVQLLENSYHMVFVAASIGLALSGSVPPLAVATTLILTAVITNIG